MSTTFEVYPKAERAPAFGELLNLATYRLGEFLHRLRLPVTPALQVELFERASEARQAVDAATPAIWSEESYAWFSIPDVPGGTDAYFETGDRERHEIWLSELLSNEGARGKEELVRRCLSHGYRWVFRRSAGQPPIIAVAYGLLAASLAELTEGVVYSHDGAWDYGRFPATASDFYTWYFDPASALGPDTREWAERVVASLL